MIKKYIKKPMEIEAIQFTESNIGEILDFIDEKILSGVSYIGGKCIEIHIETLKGLMTAYIGDYIIKGVNGEFYPCSQDIFEDTYKEVC